MRQKRISNSPSRRPPGASPEQASSPGALAALAALGAASALWALFLWDQLILARSGGSSFCAASEDAGCAAAWDSPFATAVHRFTGLPIAGWGLVWGVAAFVFPLFSLLRRAQARPASILVWASRWMAVSGVAVVFLMVAVSVTERSFCSSCALIYGLVIGYGGITLSTWQQMSPREARRGLALAVAATGIAFLLLLYPGLRTPRASTREAGQEGLAESSGTGDPVRDRQITELVASLSPQLKQTLSDSLLIYRSAPKLTLPPPRVLLGSSKAAPVRITEFTDVLCSHCARLHATLGSLRERLPPGSFTIEPRQYPLDTGCNPRARGRHGRSPRCLAAAAQICLERHEKAFEFSASLFENQVGLTEKQIYDLAAPYLSRSDLERCSESRATRAKLEDDLALAYRYHARGVPLVLVNGRRGTSFETFLHAMVLTRGAASHPAFSALPEPVRRADL